MAIFPFLRGAESRDLIFAGVRWSQGHTYRHWDKVGVSRSIYGTSSDALDAETEVELPRRSICRKVAILICERDTNLYYLEEVDVAAHSLIVIIGRRPKVSYWPRDYTREFRVLDEYLSEPDIATG